MHKSLWGSNLRLLVYTVVLLLESLRRENSLRRVAAAFILLDSHPESIGSKSTSQTAPPHAVPTWVFQCVSSVPDGTVWLMNHRALCWCPPVIEHGLKQPNPRVCPATWSAALITYDKRWRCQSRIRTRPRGYTLPNPTHTLLTRAGHGALIRLTACGITPFKLYSNSVIKRRANSTFLPEMLLMFYSLEK